MVQPSTPLLLIGQSNFLETKVCSTFTETETANEEACAFQNVPVKIVGSYVPPSVLPGLRFGRDRSGILQT